MAEIAEIPVQNPLPLGERISRLNPTDSARLVKNAGIILKEKSSKESLPDRILDDPTDILFENAKRILASGEKKTGKSRVHRFVNAAVIAATLLTATGGVIYAAREPILEGGRKIETPDVVYDPNKIFATANAPFPAPSPTETPIPIPTQTAYPKALAEKEVGSRNIAELFLGDLVDKFKQKRAERLKNDPDFAKRIQKEFLNSDRINILYLGTDQIRGRGDINDEGIGRSDSIIVLSFDPHTFKTTAISLPRDLYSPEIAKYVPDMPKINLMTMINVIPEVKTKVDANELAKKIIEDATGMPIDWIIKTNVDFLLEAGNIFDSLFPDGLEINVPNEVIDPDAPVVDGKKGLMFEKGVQKMKGERIMRYATERRIDRDFGRSDRQRQVIQASMMALLPSIIGDLAKGDSQTLDKLVSALEQEKNANNLFYDVDLIEIVKTWRNSLKSLSGTPKGIAVMGVLAANSKDLVDKIRNNPGEMFTSIGWNYANGVQGYDGISMIKPIGSNIGDPPLLYWDPIRKRIYQESR